MPFGDSDKNRSRKMHDKVELWSPTVQQHKSCLHHLLDRSHVPEVVLFVQTWHREPVTAAPERKTVL